MHIHTSRTHTLLLIIVLLLLSCKIAGECGLDFNRNFSPPDVQEQWFEAQVKLALELRKPLFMHCRDAGAKFAEILTAAGTGKEVGRAAGF